MVRNEAADNGLLEAVRFYRGLGFFVRWASLPDKALAEHLRAMAASEQPAVNDFEMVSGNPELALLAVDEDRVWWDDAEPDMGAGDEYYVQLLETLARISRGAFQPSRIRETWLSDDGPIQLSFVEAGERHEIELEWNEGWLDYAILDLVDELLAMKGFHLEYLDTGDDHTIAVVVLTEAEREVISRARPNLLGPG